MVKSVPGEIDAVYDPRDFSVTIAVHYDARRVQINYVTSENLKYKGGMAGLASTPAMPAGSGTWPPNS